MKRFMLLCICLLSSLVAAETFEPSRMQFGCPSISDYERSENAKGYGAGKVFTESGCIYLRDIELILKESKDGYIQICRKDSPKMCYWTIDTRPRASTDM